MRTDRTRGGNAGDILKVRTKENGGYFGCVNLERKLTMGAAIAYAFPFRMESQ